LRGFTELKQATFFVLLVTVLVLTTGCAIFGGADRQSDEYIVERATQRWKALVDRDFKKAYAFESPGYRKAKSLDYFKKQFGGWVEWTGASVMHVKRKSEQIAEVRIHLNYDSYQRHDDSMQNASSYFNEKWIYTDRNWWYVSK
jgi:hypothetical protein